VFKVGKEREELEGRKKKDRKEEKMTKERKGG
jgi:hypothetical protein